MRTETRHGLERRLKMGGGSRHVLTIYTGDLTASNKTNPTVFIYSFKIKNFLLVSEFLPWANIFNFAPGINGARHPMRLFTNDSDLSDDVKISPTYLF